MPQPHQTPKRKGKSLISEEFPFTLVIRDGIFPSSRLPLNRRRVSERSGPRSPKEELRATRMHGHVRQIQVRPLGRSVRRML
ncbi:hypothetical protein HNY73_012114 [Argiope bruennichi]|uniref:Uncharacterized protein n=1 Tax=Argiope bruennichi TaxID=94029 RepID=A0A8T0EYC9_ARGBR|nr:hypothetical protein HNY73_012114 [Argiope bruennichi]